MCHPASSVAVCLSGYKNRAKLNVCHSNSWHPPHALKACAPSHELCRHCPAKIPPSSLSKRLESFIKPPLVSQPQRVRQEHSVVEFSFVLLGQLYRLRPILTPRLRSTSIGESRITACRAWGGQGMGGRGRLSPAVRVKRTRQEKETLRHCNSEKQKMVSHTGEGAA